MLISAGKNALRREHNIIFCLALGITQKYFWCLQKGFSMAPFVGSTHSELFIYAESQTGIISISNRFFVHLYSSQWKLDTPGNDWMAKSLLLKVKIYFNRWFHTDRQSSVISRISRRCVSPWVSCVCNVNECFWNKTPSTNDVYEIIYTTRENKKYNNKWNLSNFIPY